MTTNTYHTTIADRSADVCVIMEIKTILTPGNSYHICTRTNGTDLLFRDQEDYVYFTNSFKDRLSECWEIISWVLLPNEAHFVIRITQSDVSELTNHSNLLGHMLNGYVQHYNRKYLRQGSLLNRSFRRKQIQSQRELKDLICQLDNLPVARDLVEEKQDWKYGSYIELQSAKFATKAGKKITKLFDGVLNYFAHHMKDGMMKFNTLPPRKWVRDWCSRIYPLRQ